VHFYWSTLVVLPYLTIGLLGALVALVPPPLMVQMLRRERHPALAFAERAESIMAVQRLGAIRAALRNVVQGLALPITWPLLLWLFRRRSSVAELADLRVRRSVPVREGRFLLFVAVVVVLLTVVDGPAWHLRIACGAILVAAIGDQMRMVLDGVNARQEMRRTVGSPLVQLGSLAVTNLAAVTFAAYVLVDWSSDDGFDVQGLAAELSTVVKLGHVSALWSARHAGVENLLVIAAAVAVYTVLISQLPRALFVGRDDDDHLAIGLLLGMAGDVVSAREWLGKVKARARPSGEAPRAYGTVDLVAGDTGEAMKSARTAARLRRLGTQAPEDDDDARLILWEWAEQLDDPEVVQRLIGWLIDDGLTDRALALIAANKGNDVVDEATLTPNRPLARAAVALHERRYDAALGELRSMRPGNAADRIVHQLLQSRAAELAASQDSWSRRRQQATADTRALLNELSPQRIEELPVWLVDWLSLDVSLRLRPRAAATDEESRAALRALEDTLHGRGGGGPRRGRSRAGPVEIVGGSAEIRSWSKRIRLFRYDIRYAGRTQAAFIYIDRAALEAERASTPRCVAEMLDSHGATAVLAALRRGEVPTRLYVDSSGVWSASYRRLPVS
jgi:hypothetical protein